MTTLAIIGSGILGRSLLYTLAKDQKVFEKITLLNSEIFAPAVSFRSTAIVAPRGLSPGHSPLGDLLIDAFKTFSQHVDLDAPKGVEKILQYTGVTEVENLSSFKSRYAHGDFVKGFLKNETYLAVDQAYLINTQVYCDWLLQEAKVMERFPVEVIDDFVIDVHENERLHVKTQQGRNLSFDKIIFAGGVYNRYWQNQETDLGNIKPVHGSFLEFSEVGWNLPSFSLTLDDHNLIWNDSLKRLLIGSTTREGVLELPSTSDLKKIFEGLKHKLNLPFPNFDEGKIVVGMREKARKREPYMKIFGNRIFMGGLYKNGYSLSLKIARDFSRQFP